MHSFKELIVWQKSVDLVVSVYDLCKELPSSERFGLTSQMQRCSVSIPSNIAEGYRRNNRKEYVQFCGVALGSAAELETQLIITQKLYKDLTTDHLIERAIEIQKMLSSLVAKLKTSS